MPMPSPIATLLPCLAAALTIAACGGRSTLRADLDTSGHAGGNTGGNTGSGGAFADAGAEAGPPPCVTWTVGAPEPIPLTDPIGDSLLSGVAVEGDRVFIGSLNNNDPSPDPTWRVRVVRSDLAELGPSQVVMKHATSTSLSGMGIASGFGHRGGVAWDQINGCRFVSLADDGSAAAAPVSIAGTWCYWPYATEGGFTTFASPSFEFSPLTMLTLDAAGQVVGTKDDVVPLQPEPTQPYARARLDDGTLVLAWSQGVGAGATIRMEHFSAAGDPLDAPRDLLPLGATTRFTLASLGQSVLMVWSPDEAGEVRAQPLTADGDALAPETLLAPADELRVGSIALAAVNGGALAAWTKGESGAYKTLTVRAVAASGAPMGEPVPVTTPPFLGKVVLLPTTNGVVVAFDAEEPATPTQVFVTRLLCGE